MPLPARRLEEITRWRLFLKENLRLESEFLHLTEYIPLPAKLLAPNFQFGSPRAAAFGLDCCTWLETCLRNLLASPRFDSDRNVVRARKKIQDMDLYRRALDALVGLSRQERMTSEQLLTIAPFRAFVSDRNPDWFRKYSKFKHDRVALANSWNMRDSLESLAGLSVVLHSFVAAGIVIDVQSRVFLGERYPSELATLTELSSS